MTAEVLRATTEAVSAGRPLPPARDIPSSFLASVKSWWGTGEKESAASEERLLRNLPFFQSSTWPRRDSGLRIVGTSSRVELSTPKRFINTFSITPTAPPASPTADPVVLLHGYGAGLGFFFRNFAALGEWVARRGAPVHVLDWLGMGRSARVPFTVKAPRADVQSRVHGAEAFFIDALEEWRAKMGHERMTLVGHSLGAYLSAAYALRYPERVGKLVLLSPAGMLGDPDAAQPSRELTDSQESIARNSKKEGRSKAPEVASKQTVKEVREEQREQRKKETRTRRLFTYLWEEGFSPFQVVRGLTVFGPMVIGKYSSRRFAGLSEEETRNMHDYILNITLAKGSGEYCISHILAPFAHARLPLVDRISALKIPVVFVYGQHDWMDPQGGEKSIEKLREAGNRNARIYIIKDAGHHVYLDNAESVNNLLHKELDRA